MVLKIRQIQHQIQQLHNRDRGRMMVLTGARQTGKTTLAAMSFPDYPVVNFDVAAERAIYEKLTAAEWIAKFPRAIIDEAQKLPSIFETVKACYDRNPDVRYLLLGSSQILLMKNISETLAGRVALRELFPFSIPEMMTESSEVVPEPSRLIRLLGARDPAGAFAETFPPELSIGDAFARAGDAFERFQLFGGMPRLWSTDWTDEDRLEWLRDYQATYLQRDLADLARLDQLDPFVRAQRAAALRSGQPINFSDLARLADISPPTAKQFMRYLEVSYQIVWLPAWFRNREKRLAKRPKLHFFDPGIMRAVAGRQGAPTGAEFESAVVAEIVKQCRALRMAVDFHHLRTTDGREVDLLIERDDGFIAIECKQATAVHPIDFRHLKNLETLLDKPLLLGLVVSNDKHVTRLDQAGASLWNVPAAGLLS